MDVKDCDHTTSGFGARRSGSEDRLSNASEVSAGILDLEGVGILSANFLTIAN